MIDSKEKIAKILFASCALISIIITLSILIFMIVLGLPLFKQDHLFSVWSEQWIPHQGMYGILPMIAGTLWIAFPATALSFPLSLGTSFVMIGLGNRRIRQSLYVLIRFMTGIPTIIYGFVGIFLLVPLIRESLGGAGMCVLAAVIVLSVMISPAMILFFSDALASVNPHYVKTARALGATRVQCLMYVLVPESIGGIISGFILAFGRAIGDTLIALMLAGNAIQIPWNVLDPARTMTAHIALVNAADFDSLAFRSIFACGITLYLLTAIATLFVRYLVQIKEFKSE